MTLLFCAKNRESLDVFDECVLFPIFPLKHLIPSIGFGFFGSNDMCVHHTHYPRSTHKVRIPTFLCSCSGKRLFSFRFSMSNVDAVFVVVVFYCSFVRSRISLCHLIYFIQFSLTCTLLRCVQSGNEDRRTNTRSKSGVSMCCCCCCYERKNLSLMSCSFSFACYFFVSRCISLCCCSSSIILTAESSIVITNAVAVAVAVAPFLRGIILFFCFQPSPLSLLLLSPSLSLVIAEKKNPIFSLLLSFVYFCLVLVPLEILQRIA